MYLIRCRRSLCHLHYIYKVYDLIFKRSWFPEARRITDLKQLHYISSKSESKNLAPKPTHFMILFYIELQVVRILPHVSVYLEQPEPQPAPS